jgi:urease accessory protein
VLEIASAVVRPGRGRSDVHRLRGAGPLKLLSPRAAGKAAWIVTSSLGGGLVDGDHVALEVTVDPGATWVVTTQASSKVYKGASSQRLQLHVRGDGTALVVPDPLVPYRAARFAQVTRIVLDGDSTLALCDVVSAGRIAYGERWAAERIATTLELSVAGTRLLLDRLVLDAAHGELAARMGRFDALGTVVLVGPGARDVAAAQLARLAGERVVPAAPVVIAGSPLGDAGAMFRLAGTSSQAVVNATRALVGDVCSRAGEAPWARKW